MSLLYPLLFKPVYESNAWGSDLMNTLGRQLPLSSLPVAQSWELSDRPEHQSVVENGSMQGKTLQELCNDYGSDLVGARYRSGLPFPLLVNIKAVSKRIPMQVGPDDVACREMQKGEPHTKMWYLLEHLSGAQIYAGLKLTATKQNFLTRLNSAALEDVIQCTLSRKGDAYFIPGGRIHGIGDGNLVYEIQQNSLTDYRFYDWGLPQESNIEAEEVADAIEAIHFTDRMQPRIAGDTSSVVRNKRNLIVTNCPYFTIEEIRLVETFCDDTKRSSFHTLFSTLADFEIVCDMGTFMIPANRTVLIPASVCSYRINVVEPTVIIKAKL